MEMCILCHEAQEILPDGAVMVLAAFVQRSTVMSENHKRPPHNPESYDPLFMHPDLSFGTHTGSCGHIMHSHCWHSTEYFHTHCDSVSSIHPNSESLTQRSISMNLCMQQSSWVLLTTHMKVWRQCV
ncbi:E3 ubiquitin-protein ligase UBR2-like [Ictalurus punctatus]|uniref:E3 ubiquitin-protein ligase n=1 Tax=Ictalurus punctatus TaxID=7998 RepID=A0A9F7QXS7_ICTPU|nr:E3 ubiquitin-protein ligase UBR2-like [Ictalurus punctatus]